MKNKEYVLVVRKNGFIGMYNMTDKQQCFNGTPETLQSSLRGAFGDNITISMDVIIEGEHAVNPLNLPSLGEYLKSNGIMNEDK